MPTKSVLDDKTPVVVCDSCRTASCWQSKFVCQNYLRAGTRTMTVRELRKLGLEHEDYWSEA